MILDRFTMTADDLWLDDEPRSASRREGPLHAAADAQQAQLGVAVRYAFAVGRRVLRRVMGDVRALGFPDQPRDEQGQWTSGGGEARISTAPDAVRSPKFDKAVEFVSQEYPELLGSHISIMVVAKGSREVRGAKTNGTTFRNIKVENGKPVRNEKGDLQYSGKYSVSISDRRATTQDYVATLVHELEHVRQWEAEGKTNEAGAYDKGHQAGRKFSMGDVRALGFPDQPRDEQGQWTSGGQGDVRLDDKGRGIAEVRADGFSSYAGVQDDQWEDWAHDSDLINDAASGKNIVGQTNSSGETVTETMAAEYQAVAGVVTKAAETHVALNPETYNVFYRGESFATEQELRDKYGRSFTTDRLTATASDKSFAEDYANSLTEFGSGSVKAQVEIQNLNGVRGIQTSPFGVPGNEVVLAKGQKFSVTVYKPERSGGPFIVKLYSKEKHGSLQRIKVIPPDADARSLRSALRTPEDVAADAVREALEDVLPGALLRAVKAGGMVAVIPEVRVAAFDPDQPRDDEGKWTDGGGLPSMSAPNSGAAVPDEVAHAKEILGKLPTALIRESGVKKIELYENQDEAATRIDAYLKEMGDYAPEGGARGLFDRGNGLMIATTFVSEDGTESGRNIYHEFAHSLKGRITDPEWEEPWGEWTGKTVGYGQDEAFAEAFAEWFVSKREADQSMLEDFKYGHPKTAVLFERWGW